MNVEVQQRTDVSDGGERSVKENSDANEEGLSGMDWRWLDAFDNGSRKFLAARRRRCW